MASKKEGDPFFYLKLSLIVIGMFGIGLYADAQKANSQEPNLNPPDTTPWFLKSAPTATAYPQLEGRPDPGNGQYGPCLYINTSSKPNYVTNQGRIKLPVMGPFDLARKLNPTSPATTFWVKHKESGQTLIFFPKNLDENGLN